MLNLNTSYPEYAQGKYDQFILIKFFPDLEKQKYFLNGKMYINCPVIYHDKNLGEGLYDGLEGASTYVNGSTQTCMPRIKFGEKEGKPYALIESLQEKNEDYVEPHFIYWPSAQKKKNVFCMYSLWLNTIEKTFLEINKIMLNQFGKYGVIITNKTEFINRIANVLLKHSKISVSECGFVEYITEEQSKGIVELNPFIKRKYGYGYQNEFRFCFDKDIEGVLEFDIEDSINDIALPIKTETFLDTLKFSNDGNIMFEDMI